MDINSARVVQKNILKRLDSDAKENLIAAVLQDETENEPASLNMMIDGISDNGDEPLCEIMFLPFLKEHKYHTFLVSIILSDEIVVDTSSELIAAITLLNSYITIGGFSFSPMEKMLIYKNTAIFDEEMTEDQLYEHAQFYISNAFSIVDSFCNVLVEIAEGKSTIKDLAVLLENE